MTYPPDSLTDRELDVTALVREYFPKASEEDAHWVLWEKTGFPCFFDGDAETCLREQLSTYKRAHDLGRDVCYCCGKIRFKSQLTDGMFCKVGLAAMRASEAGT